MLNLQVCISNSLTAATDLKTFKNQWKKFIEENKIEQMRKYKHICNNTTALGMNKEEISEAEKNEKERS